MAAHYDADDWGAEECPKCNRRSAYVHAGANMLICRAPGCGYQGDVGAEPPPEPEAKPNGSHANEQPQPKTEKPKDPHAHNLGVALALAAVGLRIFPVDVYFDEQKQKWDKVPRVKDWENAASANPNQIRAWWKQWPGSCPGIALKHAGLVAIDADRHRFGEDGVTALKGLEAKYKPFADHPVCLTAGDGEHHIFCQAPGIALTNSRGKLPAGVDVRGVGGFIIAPGSMRDDRKLWRAPGFLKAYKAGKIPIIPDWLLLQIQPPQQKQDDSTKQSKSKQTNGAEPPGANELDEELVISALKFIPADDRNEIWMRIGGALFDTKWPNARKIWDDWSETTTKNNHDPAGQDKAWKSFARPYKGRRATIATIFKLAQEQGWQHPGQAAAQEDGTDAIAQMNRIYCVVNDSGSVLVFRDRYDEIMGRRIYDRMSAPAFKLLHKNEKVIVKGEGGETEKKPVADVWLSHRSRRTYQSVVFDPSEKASKAALNLWRGYGVEPHSGDWSRLKAHIRDNVCTGN
jgi:Bifunctional DNA primase/polymerase, N-terminal/Primase C terminal 2 (PriCT-2)